MPALKKIAPIILKEIVERAGWSLYLEDEYTWSLVNSSGESVEIPKKGSLVSFQVMEKALGAAEILPGDYFRLLTEVRADRKRKRLPEDGSETRPTVN